MNKLIPVLSCAALTCGAIAQSVAVYPNEYVNVPEGPLNSPNLPLANGTSRVQCLYEDVDLDIPSGHTITKLGFREDGTSTQFQAGRALQLEVRMGWTTGDHVSMGTNFDNNYASPPVTVFGPALYTLPDLHDAANPLPNGQFFITLTTPFQYVPNGQNLLVEYRVFGTSAGGSPFTYRVDRADYYSPVTYGPPGCQHSGGLIPDLTVQPTRPGLSYQCNVNNGPGNSPAFLVVNIGSTLAPPYPLAPIFAGIDPACTGQIAPGSLAILGGATGSTGSAFWSFQIPNDNAFGDLPITSQAMFLDFFTPGGLAVSRGGEVVTGIRSRSSIVYAGGAPTSVNTGSKNQWYLPVAFFEHQ